MPPPPSTESKPPDPSSAQDPPEPSQHQAEPENPQPPSADPPRKAPSDHHARLPKPAHRQRHLMRGLSIGAVFIAITGIAMALALRAPDPQPSQQETLTSKTLTPEALTPETLTPETLTPETLAPETPAPETLTPEAPAKTKALIPAADGQTPPEQAPPQVTQTLPKTQQKIHALENRLAQLARQLSDLQLSLKTQSLDLAMLHNELRQERQNTQAQNQKLIHKLNQWQEESRLTQPPQYPLTPPRAYALLQERAEQILSPQDPEVARRNAQLLTPVIADSPLTAKERHRVTVLLTNNNPTHRELLDELEALLQNQPHTGNNLGSAQNTPRQRITSWLQNLVSIKRREEKTASSPRRPHLKRFGQDAPELKTAYQYFAALSPPIAAIDDWLEKTHRRLEDEKILRKLLAAHSVFQQPQPKTQEKEPEKPQNKIKAANPSPEPNPSPDLNPSPEPTPLPPAEPSSNPASPNLPKPITASEAPSWRAIP